MQDYDKSHIYIELDIVDLFIVNRSTIRAYFKYKGINKIKVMEKYYGNADEYGNCSEECKKLNTGRCIGSIACSECTYCAGSGKDDYGSVTWIKCRYLDEAIGKDVD